MNSIPADFSAIVAEIDEQIRTRLWFDFHVFHYDGHRLVVAGSIDLCYYHEMEVIFENVFFIRGFFNGWHSDTSKPVFIQTDNVSTFNTEFEIEQGYTLFIFKTEDYEKDVIIAAEKVSFNTDTVFYYERDDLEGNQRIADFVKRRAPEGPKNKE